MEYPRAKRAYRRRWVNAHLIKCKTICLKGDDEGDDDDEESAGGDGGDFDDDEGDGGDDGGGDNDDDEDDGGGDDGIGLLEAAILEEEFDEMPATSEV